MKRIIESSFVAAILTLTLLGCSDKINQTGSWLVTYDSTLVPQYIDSHSDSIKVTTSQVDLGLATGSSSVLSLGKVPWTEADLVLAFSALNPVYGAQSILSASIVFTRAPYTTQPSGYNVQNMQLAGYSMDTVWNASTITWDSVNAIGYGSQNIVLSQTITDTTVVVQIDTGIVRQWVNATEDTTVSNRGFIMKPTNTEGVLSVYSPLASSSSYYPTCVVIYVQDGVVDTSSISLSYGTSVAQTTITNVAPQGPYRIVQSGTGLRENLIFDLSRIPNYSIVNYAQLTLYADTVAEAPYSGNLLDTLVAYYVTDPSTYSISTSNLAVSVPVGNTNTFDVTTIVQHMLNSKNYGFLITQYNEMSNVDPRFVYDEDAPDSLRPRLMITYTPAVKK